MRELGLVGPETGDCLAFGVGRGRCEILVSGLIMPRFSWGKHALPRKRELATVSAGEMVQVIRPVPLWACGHGGFSMVRSKRMGPMNVMQLVSRGAASLVVCAGLALGAATAMAQQAGAPPASAKKPVATAADLPVHVYTIQGSASEFVQSDGPFREFLESVKANLVSDLAQYDIKDATTLRAYAGLEMQIAMLENRYDDVPALIERMPGLETKESARLMSGNVILAYLDAKKAVPAGKAGEASFDASFEQSLQQRVGGLPWEKVAEDVKAARGRAQFLTRDLLLGGIKSQLDPVVAENGNTLTSDLANGLVNARMAMEKLLPLQPLIERVYTRIITEREANVQRIDVWTPSVYTFADGEKGMPVVIGVWDSGVDTSVFSQDQVWTNPKETPNGKDDDANGFVDDVHGIAFDLQNEKTPSILHSSDALVMSYAEGLKLMKGWSDLSSAIDSEDAAKLRKHISGLPADKVGEFTEDLGLMGNISHGTHVAGIAADGNPFARLLAARLTFDWKNIPQFAPTEELAKRTAQMYQETVDYFRAQGVRVVNMSWGGDVKSIESELERKGVGKTPEERQEMAARFFKIGADGLEKAMRSAPEILFVAAAGNSDNDNAFAQFIPSGLNVPNMLTIGAIDETGKPTGFTTFGKNVSLYANGFEVESFVPGGTRLRFSGTSMAAPQLANLVGKMLAVRPSLTPAQVIDIVKNGAVPMEGYEGRYIIHQKRTMEKVKAMR